MLSKLTRKFWDFKDETLNEITTDVVFSIMIDDYINEASEECVVICDSFEKCIDILSEHIMPHIIANNTIMHVCSDYMQIKVLVHYLNVYSLFNQDVIMVITRNVKEHEDFRLEFTMHMPENIERDCIKKLEVLNVKEFKCEQL